MKTIYTLCFSFQLIKAVSTADSAFDEYPLSILIVMSSFQLFLFLYVAYQVLKPRANFDIESNWQIMKIENEKNRMMT